MQAASRRLPSWTTGGPEETRRLAARLGALLRPGDVVLLEGELGAGKTTFIQGLAAGMGLRDAVTSPTFTLVHEYRGGVVPLFHFDPYRLAGPDDVADLGFEEYLEAGGVVAVEWAERLGWLRPAERLSVRLQTEGEARRITLNAHGSRYVDAVAGMEADLC